MKQEIAIRIAKLLVPLLIGGFGLDAKTNRSSKTKADFQRANPCPSTGRRIGPCPGYVKDHIKPLGCSGADAPSNMQWQTKADARAKDRMERKNCESR